MFVDQRLMSVEHIVMFFNSDQLWVHTKNLLRKRKEIQVIKNGNQN